jgi:adenine-specific DNA glycosylase
VIPEAEADDYLEVLLNIIDKYNIEILMPSSGYDIFPFSFRDVTWPLAIVKYHGKILLRRRHADGLLAKLWELPGAEIAPMAKPAVAIRKELRPLAVAGLRPQHLGELRHSITDRRIHAPVLLYHWPLEKRLPPGWRWILPSQLHRYATSSMTGKAVKLFIEHEKRPT